MTGKEHFQKRLTYLECPHDGAIALTLEGLVVIRDCEELGCALVCGSRITTSLLQLFPLGHVISELHTYNNLNLGGFYGAIFHKSVRQTSFAALTRKLCTNWN